jgi:hypothetical protein
MRYYHVVAEGYCPGEDLLSYDELCRLGRCPFWKWDQVYAETDVVALSLEFSHARAFRDNHGGTILVIDLPRSFEEQCVKRNREKFPCVRDRIPARYISGEADSAGYPVPMHPCASS